MERWLQLIVAKSKKQEKGRCKIYTVACQPLFDDMGDISTRSNTQTLDSMNLITHDKIENHVFSILPSTLRLSLRPSMFIFQISTRRTARK